MNAVDTDTIYETKGSGKASYKSQGIDELINQVSSGDTIYTQDNINIITDECIREGLLSETKYHSLLVVMTN